MLGSLDIICSQATFSNGEINRNRNTWTTRTRTWSTETHQWRAKQGEAERTVEPTHNHGIGGIPFITKKGGKMSISHCSSFSHAPWRREHKSSKTVAFHLLYALLINSVFLPSCLQNVAAGQEERLLSAKALNTLNIKKRNDDGDSSRSRQLYYQLWDYLRALQWSDSPLRGWR